MLQSLPVVDSVIRSETISGPGWHRYGVRPALFGQPSGSTDGYGDCYVPDPTKCSPTGAPWFGPAAGSGHPWPILDGERAEQDLQNGALPRAAGLALTMQRMAWGTGTLPEQVSEDPHVPASGYGANPRTASIGFFNGEAAGSADPLIWAQSQSSGSSATCKPGGSSTSRRLRAPVTSSTGHPPACRSPSTCRRQERSPPQATSPRRFRA